MQRALVERAMAGDHEAFSELARLGVRRLYAVARLILRDADRAEDATQEALFVAWRDLRALRDPDRFEAWLHRLLVRECYREARSGRRRTEVEGRVQPIAVCRRPGRDARVTGRARAWPGPTHRRASHRPRAASLPGLLLSGDRRYPGHPDRHRQVTRPSGDAADAHGPRGRCAAPPNVGGTADMNSYQNGERFPDIDRILADVFAEDAPPSEPPLLIPALLARTALTRQRPAWRIPSRWLPPNVAWRPRTSWKVEHHGHSDPRSPPRRPPSASSPSSAASCQGPPAPAATTWRRARRPRPQPRRSPCRQRSAPTADLEAGTTYFLDDLWDDGSADLILTVPATGWVHTGDGHLAKHQMADGWYSSSWSPHGGGPGTWPPIPVTGRAGASSIRPWDRPPTTLRPRWWSRRRGTRRPDGCDGRRLHRQEGRAVAARGSALSTSPRVTAESSSDGGTRMIAATGPYMYPDGGGPQHRVHP